MNKLSWGFKKFLNFSVLFIATLALILNISNSQLVLADEATPSAEQSTSTEPLQTPEQTTPSESSAPSLESTSTSTPVSTSTDGSANEEATQSATPVTTSEASSNTISTTDSSDSSLPAGTLELNRTYSMLESSSTKIKFTNLPAGITNFSFNKGTLSTQQVSQLGALDSNVYEITSNMTNGTFTYDLTLPYPAGVSGTNFKVFYASDVNGLNSPTQVTQSITDNGDGTFTIHNLNHFTVFVVVNPNSQANCDAITIGTTPGSTCYTTVQAAVNAASNGDTINIGNTGSPYNETVYVNKQLTITGTGNPSVDAFVLQITPVTITGITTSVSIATPTVSLTNPVNNGNQTTATISGTGAANATVNYTISGTSGTPITGTGTVSAGGAISISVNLSSLGEGALTLTVYLTSGSYSSSNATANAFKDTTGPASATGLTITNPINISNNTNISFSGNGEAGTTANWTLSNGASTLSGTTTVSGAGTFSVTGRDLSSFPDGTITLSITLTDSSGNTSSASTTTATKDTVAPTLTTATISSNNSNSGLAKTGNTVTLSFVSSETIQTPTVTIAGNTVTTTNTSGNTWVATYVMTGTDTQGTISFNISFSDTSSNAGTSVTSTTNSSSVTFDRTVPTLIATSITSSNSNSNFAKTGDTITVTLTGSESIQTPVVTIAGNSITPVNTSGNTWVASYIMTGADTEGLIAYTLTFQDLASNAGTGVSTNSAITFDRTNPTLLSNSLNSSNSNSNFAKAGDTVTLNFTASESLQTPIVTIGGNTVIATNTSGNNWTATYVMTGTDTEGLIAYTLTFQDLASNTGTAVSTTSGITFDRTVPALTTTTITSSNANGSYAKTGDTITLTFTGSEALQTPVVTIGGNSITPVNTAGNTWVATYTMTGTDIEGAVAYTINFQDLASNPGSAVNTNSAITFDRTVPTLTSTTITSSNSNGSFAKTGDTITSTFTGSETLQTPVVTIGGNSVVPTNTVGNTWTATYTMTGADTEGLIAYTLTFQDLASNAGTAVNTNSAITFDRTNPTLTTTTITTSNSNANYARVGDTITLAFTSSETIQTPVVTIGGNTVIAINTSGNIWTASYVMLGTDTEGLIAYTITFQDLSSNPGTAVSTNSAITFDSTTPTLSSITATSSNTNPTYARTGNTITVTFTGSETLQTPTVTISGNSVIPVNVSGNNWSATYTLTSTDTEGFIVYSIAYQDLASNSGTTGNITSVIAFDSTNPAGSWTTPTANATVSGTVALSASATDTNGVASVVFAYQRNDGVDTFHTIATLNSGLFTTDWNASGLALDNYTLRMIVTDTVGNITTVDQIIALATVINQASIQLSAITTSGIVINWTTADPTASRVIYDTVSHPTLGTAPNYGYSTSTANFDTLVKVLNHMVTLSGLNASTTYYYRTVSSGSPEAVSNEFSFTTSAQPSPSASGGYSAPGAPVCNDQRPGSAPALLSAKVKGNKVILTWSKAKDPVTYYLIKYGLGHDSYQFGVPNVGNVTEYEIGGLQSGVTYYFRVRAGNGCNANGEFSNELSVKAGNSLSESFVNTVSNLLGVRDALAAESDLYESESTESAKVASESASFNFESTPSAKIEVKKEASNLLKNILIGSGIVFLITSGLFYYSTLQKKS